ncbi:MAG: hypothetical protein IMW94_01505 [Thermoanaerobacter sp.]|nr:hypothetical protein [Thermoanaerobacter sp.]
MNEIPVVVRHTKLTDEEHEVSLNYDNQENWERNLPRQFVPKEEFVDFLERCSRQTERMTTAAPRVNLIVSFEYWPEFVLVQIYDDYIE